MGSLILFYQFCQGGRLFGWGRLLGSEEYCIWQSITLMVKNHLFEAKSDFYKFKFFTPEDIFYNIENNFNFQNAYFAK